MTEQRLPYYLLPFDFVEIAGHEILVNELGDMMTVPCGTVRRIIDRSIARDDLYKSLVAGFFISEQPVPILLDLYAERLREKKRFLEDWTGLHIFVVTLRCNQNCVYCQASSRTENSKQCSMSREIMQRSVELMFSSPSASLTMEFQGGEPTLEPDLIEYGLQLAEEINRKENRKMTYVLCTNSVCLTDHMLDICRRYGVVISTSLDGPSSLHNANRGKADSYDKVVTGISKARAYLGYDKVSALMTASA